MLSLRSLFVCSAQARKEVTLGTLTRVYLEVYLVLPDSTVSYAGVL
jgi:hypothetical protein